MVDGRTRKTGTLRTCLLRVSFENAELLEHRPAIFIHLFLLTPPPTRWTMHGFHSIRHGSRRCFFFFLPPFFLHLALATGDGPAVEKDLLWLADTDTSARKRPEGGTVK